MTKLTERPSIHSLLPLSFDQEWLDNVFSENQTVWIGFSGGVDSHVLLHAVVSQLSSDQKKKLVGIHVHHGLSRYADGWSAHCEEVCQQLQVRFVAHRVQLEKQSSIEDAARNARYQVFEKVLSAKDVLLLAHHSDDQVETVLFRLLRGTGGKGLSGMPNTRAIGEKGARLIRPFLNLSKADIESYADQKALTWIQDDSNTDERFTRNFLRQSVVPTLKERFPRMEQSISSTAQRIETDYLMLSQFANRQLEDWCNEFGGLMLSFIDDKSLDETLFWLRHFLQRQGVSLSQAQLESTASMLDGAEDKHPEFQLKKHRIMRHKNTVYLLPLDQKVILGSLSVGQTLKRSFDDVQITGSDHCVLKSRPRGAVLSFEKGQSRKLKKWLNDLQVPSWWRDHLPYIFIGNDLIAIGDLWRHPEHLHIQVQWHVSAELPLLIQNDF